MARRADLPAVRSQFRGPVLIMGGGRCLWDDLARIDAAWSGQRLAVNDIAGHYHGTIEHAATLHPEYMPGWLAYRDGHNYGNRGHVYTHSDKARPGIQFAWSGLDTVGGTSGLFACLIALLMGYERIVLAGVPMDNGGHYFDPPGMASPHPLDDRPNTLAWEWARDNVFEGRVRSLAGNTRFLLGEP